MIRRAKTEDIEEILSLLKIVNKVHYDLYPTIFKLETKYGIDELKNIICDDNKKIFVYVEDNKVLGYLFTVHKEIKNDRLLCDTKELYIDDLCVDLNSQNKGIGHKLFEYVKEYAKENNYNKITLNVWNLNVSAFNFYENIGFKKIKTFMEYDLEDRNEN